MARDVLFGVVEAGDHRRPNEDRDLGELAPELAEVIQDLLVRDACSSLVLLGIEALDVEVDPVGQGSRLSERLPAAKSGGFDGGVDPSGPRRFEQRANERTLRERLAPAQREPATRARIERIVFFDGAHHVGDGHPVTGDLQGTRGANVGAVAASVAAASVDEDATLVANGERLLQTDREAAIAVIGPDAAIAGLNELGLPRLAFGIGAPDAG